jgi:Asp-tRNA(Asn)/Glu-tRNA(Gln) amidotransferase A subunit family amidase
MKRSGDYVRKIDEALARCRTYDAVLRAWVRIDDLGAAAAAHALDDGVVFGPLAGASLGVKDVLDLAGLPTQAGSAARANAAPATKDACAVARLREAGAVPLGKTVTTEFATMDPGPTRNPYDLAHTPGGSSSGSAAAVAAGMVDLALGTQTAASLCRPAAYCGVAAYKPSYGLVPVEGMVPLSPSFDTVGVMTRRAGDLRAAAEALTGEAMLTTARSARIAVLGATWRAGNAESVVRAHDHAAAIMRDLGHATTIVDLPVDAVAIVADHRSIMGVEAFSCHGALLSLPPERVGPMFRALLTEGAAISRGQVDEARARLVAARDVVWSALAGFDAVLIEPVPDTAPRGLASTGPVGRLVPWTVFGGPLVVVPVGFADNFLPTAVMIAAKPGDDARALALAENLATALPALPKPALTMEAAI